MVTSGAIYVVYASSLLACGFMPSLYIDTRSRLRLRGKAALKKSIFFFSAPALVRDTILTSNTRGGEVFVCFPSLSY